MSILLATSNFDSYIKEDKIRSYQLPHFGNVCPYFFQTFWMCGPKIIQRIFSWIQEHKSMLPKTHSNTGRQPKNILPIEIANKSRFFIKSFGNQHGENQALLDFLTTMRNNAKLSKIIIRKPPKDVCDKCTLYKCALKVSSNYINEDLDEQLITHVSDYQKIREVYENDIQKAKSSDHSSFCVFLFNFAQNIELPHNPKQPSLWYYLSLLKIHQFGLVDEGIDKYWHTIYTESKASKGLNEVTLMLNHFLVSVIGKAKEIKLWTDNC
ncbi:12135_t:CDS:2, partial [Dentiscutata heterogama]